MIEIELRQELNHHLQDSERRWLEFNDKLDAIMNNHIEHIKNEVNECKLCLVSIQSDLKWIKIIGGFLILQAVAVLIKLFL